MVDMTIVNVLSQAGLAHLVDAFSEIGYQRFKSLLIQVGHPAGRCGGWL